MSIICYKNKLGDQKYKVAKNATTIDDFLAKNPNATEVTYIFNEDDDQIALQEKHRLDFIKRCKNYQLQPADYHRKFYDERGEEWEIWECNAHTRPKTVTIRNTKRQYMHHICPVHANHYLGIERAKQNKQTTVTIVIKVNDETLPYFHLQGKQFTISIPKCYDEIVLDIPNDGTYTIDSEHYWFVS